MAGVWTPALSRSGQSRLTLGWWECVSGPFNFMRTLPSPKMALPELASQLSYQRRSHICIVFLGGGSAQRTELIPRFIEERLAATITCHNQSKRTQHTLQPQRQDHMESP